MDGKDEEVYYWAEWLQGHLCIHLICLSISLKKKYSRAGETQRYE